MEYDSTFWEIALTKQRTVSIILFEKRNPGRGGLS